MAKVNGFEIVYSHRGSWKADLSANGVFIEQVPVAWNADWRRSDGVTYLTVWFKSSQESETTLRMTSFNVAIARKRQDKASNKDITNILEVKPLKLVPDENRPELGSSAGVLCEIIRRVQKDR